MSHEGEKGISKAKISERKVKKDFTSNAEYICMMKTTAGVPICRLPLDKSN